MRILAAILLTLLVAKPAFATFSIVAFDPRTGDLGVAVASRVFGVGNHVPWAEAGVCAVATQASMNGGYGLSGLELLRQGLTAPQVVDRLLAEDQFPNKEGRQVAVVDAKAFESTQGELSEKLFAYLTGDKKKALEAFKTVYKTVLDDKEFVASLPK